MTFSHLSVEYEREMLRRDGLPDIVKKAIIDFVDDDLLLENIRERRRSNYFQHLMLASRWVHDKFLNPSKDDIKEIFTELNDGYADRTKVTYLRMLKKFYSKTLSKRKFESLFEGVKVQQSDLITISEMKAIIDNCNNSRDNGYLFNALRFRLQGRRASSYEEDKKCVI